MEEIIESRAYKYSTKQTNYRDIKRLGILDLDDSEFNSGLIISIVEKIPNQNSRKSLYITARSVFKDLGVSQDLPYLQATYLKFKLSSIK